MSVSSGRLLSEPPASAGAPIHVVATTVAGTRDALAAALAAAETSESRVYVLARSGITADSSVEAADAAHAFANEIRRIPAAGSPRVSVLTALSRRPADLFPLLPPRALVYVGGGGGRWWPSAEKRLARAIARLGCCVIFVLAHEP
jgi:hypothetical protein